MSDDQSPVVLAIAKGIVEAHGGSIGVRSQVGSGSEFYFTVPLDTNFALTNERIIQTTKPTVGIEDHTAESIDFWKTFPDQRLDNRP